MDYYKNQTYYDVLGVSEDASLESIERAKNRLKFGDSDDRVPFSMWEKIDEAYSILSDSEKRKEYDKSLKESIISNEEKAPTEDNNIYSNSDGTSSSVLDDEEVIDLNSYATSKSDNSDVIHSNSDHTSSSALDDDDNIYSNSDHTSSSILDNEEIEDVRSSIEFSDKIVLPKRIKLRKENFYSTLSEDSYLGIIKDIQTEERNILNLYNQKTEEQIEKLLSSPHNNIELEKNRIKYENQIELLKEMIEIRKSARKKENELSKSDLRLLALKYELYLQKFKLKQIERKIEEYNNSSEVNKVNQELSEVNQEISKTDEKFNIKNIKFVKNIMDFSSKKYSVVKEKLGSYMKKIFNNEESIELEESKVKAK